MWTKWLLALALAALPKVAQAEQGYRNGRWEISLDPGVAIPLGATYDQMSNSGELQLTGGYQYNRYLTIGGELGWQFNHRWGGFTASSFARDFDQDGVVDRVSYSSNIHEKILGLSPFVKVGQWFDVLSYKTRPYLVASSGFYQAWTNSGTITINGRDQVSGKQVGPIVQRFDTSSNSYFGFTGGGGIELQIDENAALGLDIRYSRIAVPSADLEFLTPSLRILYLF